MACRVIATGNGGFAIVCGRGQRRQKCSTPECSGTMVALCDYPVIKKGKATTCSARMCPKCRGPWGDDPDKDLCPPHYRRVAGDAKPERPARGDMRVHVATGKVLHVVDVREVGGAEVLTFSTEAPDGPRCGHLQTVPLSKWIEKTRPL